MCGICGVIGAEVSLERLRSATTLMMHRGPNDDGFYRSERLALGMRRLSIIDVEGGHQPKGNEDGTVQVILNGEIYNYRELRQELARRGHAFASLSDTEVVAHAYEEWDESCFRRLSGIFAVAIWDLRKQRLLLARDHLGVKPLYYSALPGGLAFGSELKAVVALLPAIPDIDPVSVRLFLEFLYVPCPRSIFAGVRKLPPGHYMSIALHDAQPRVCRFWSPDEVAPLVNHGELDREDAAELVAEAVQRAVARQMVSDVPLGAFLSGGVDSSLVVAAMQRASDRTVDTFSIGFAEASFDESPAAREVSRRLGTHHHTWEIGAKEAIAVVTELPRYFDEPFGDASALPTYLVSALARRYVTVALSGDGGDELFGGYGHYRRMRHRRRWWDVPPGIRRRALEVGISAPGRLGTLSRRIEPVLRPGSLSAGYRALVAVTREPLLSTLVGHDGPAEEHWPSGVFQDRTLDDAMLLTDLTTYLPDDILVKVDRASMAHSLEARVPLLDLEVVELALSLPRSLRIGHSPKQVLRDVLKRYLPADLVDRPKHGFSVPVSSWLREGLRPLITERLARSRLSEHGSFNADAVQSLLAGHLEGTADHGHALWAVLMFQLWHDSFVTSFRPTDGQLNCTPHAGNRDAR